jgi:spermidine synthase
MASSNNQFHWNKDTIVLLFSTLIIAFCGLLYELLIGSASSYLLGNSVRQFSFTIGAFMTSFGIGSYLSRFIKKDLIRIFFIIETAIGFLGSICILTLFYFYSVSDLFIAAMFFFIIAIGVLVGLEIPVIGRIINEIKDDIRLTLANLMSFDYLGAMAGSVLLPLVLLPQFGLLKSSILVGTGNLLVSFLFALRFRKFLSFKWIMVPVILMLLDGILFSRAGSLEDYIEQRFYDDKIIYRGQSPYQKIILTQEGDDLRLFLDGNIQFSSKDEYRYHESLIHIPIASAGLNHSFRALILGGGDGLAARELLKYPEIEEILICDLDPVITQISHENVFIRLLNKDSLKDPKVRVINRDAYQYLEENLKQRVHYWDLIVVDLPDPNNESLAKLYTVKFYKLIQKSLNKQGIAITQATSPYHAREVFWCIYNTIRAAGFRGLLPFQADVPSFGVWGFVMFSMENIAIPENFLLEEDQLRFITKKNLSSLFSLPKDSSYIKTKINRIFHPVILEYYDQSWKNY